VKGSRWVVVSAAAAVVLVSPGVGAGKVAPRSLAWTQGGIVVPSYGFATLASGSRASTNFRLRNVGPASSGKFAVRLTGSSAFSISSTGCTGKNLGVRKWCRVTVAYAPSQAGATDSAVLMATREHRTAARLEVSGCSASRPVYWADSDSGTVNEGLFAEGCITTVTTLASGQDDPTSLAVDSTHVYWTNPFDGTVNEVPVGGGPVTALASGQAWPNSVAVDGTNVYWVNSGTYSESSGTVNEVPVGGGSVTTLATGQDYPTSVAVDGTHVCWLNYENGYDGTVNEVPVGGGTVTTLATGQPYPASVAVDGTNVYWANAYYLNGGVNEVPVGGGVVTTLASGYNPYAVAVDGAYVYFARDDGTVNEVPVGGGSVTTLAGGQTPLSLAVNGTHVYWGDYNDGMVKEVPLGGGSVHVVARNQGYPQAVAVG
jgi:hypothetical protein